MLENTIKIMRFLLLIAILCLKGFKKQFLCNKIWKQRGKLSLMYMYYLAICLS